ncbi:unnamed protein product [Linum trigynum]|uniref:Uncharacterized protein n=1 Tax=Linum trigynum TaxID=586398 RepID=A0AAV2FSR8_9ROSI
MDKDTTTKETDEQGVSNPDEIQGEDNQEIMATIIQKQIEEIKLVDEDALIVQDDDIDATLVHAISLLGLT